MAAKLGHSNNSRMMVPRGELGSDSDAEDEDGSRAGDDSDDDPEAAALRRKRKGGFERLPIVRTAASASSSATSGPALDDDLNATIAALVAAREAQIARGINPEVAERDEFRAPS
jgi:hypothetical protein